MEVEPEGRSAQEVVALWHYIADRLEKNFRRTVFAAPGSKMVQGTPVNRVQQAGGFGRRVAQ
jgi:chromosome partitioning protein